jgi:CBS domain containing-hemolysin-like protein
MLTAPAVAPLDLGPLLETCLRASVEILPWLLAAAAFATLRKSLQRAHPARILAGARSGRTRLEPLLARADGLQTSAGVFEVASRAAFAATVARAFAQGRGTFGWTEVGLTVAVVLPALLLGCDAVAGALAAWRGDAILRTVLPAFHLLQLPLRWLARGLEAVRHALMRIVGLDPNPADPLRIVEGLREVIEDSEISRDLDETEREIIGNVMEFRDVSVSAIMTPRTQIHGVEVDAGLDAAARELAQSAHSRIPVYEGSLDTIIGVLTARDVVQAAAETGSVTGAVKPWLRAAYFVPETKPISELLTEMRREKLKLAIVLDEYGGTAGLVTVGDILREIVGDIHDEFDEPQVQPIRRLSDGTVEVDASLHVSDVNEELDTGIPEGEDYETLAGFVLSEMGRFPKRGETFQSNGREFIVADANDRRVLKVLIRTERAVTTK